MANSTKFGTKTIGILVSSADDKFESALLRGVSDVVTRAHMNWICFTSGSIRSHHGFESQRNLLYDLVNFDVVDSLVISATLGHGVSRDEFRSFCLNYRPLPIVTVAVELDGIPSVVSDGYRGIRETVDHLVTVHGRKRAAFIRGPVGHQEAEERFRAFTEASKSHGFCEEDVLRRVVIGDYTIESGRHAMEELIASGETFDAVVGANDSMILGALEILKARGYNVPRDVSITGFDDTEDGRHALPSLTSCRQLVYEMGLQAGKLILAEFRQESAPNKIVIPPALITRESCGCSNQELRNAAVTFRPLLTQRVELRRVTLDAMCQILPGYLRDAHQPWLELMFDTFRSDMHDESGSHFITTLKRLLPQGLTISGPGDFWQDVLSAMRKAVLHNAGDGFNIARAEMLWQQARVLVGEEIRKFEVGLRLHTENRSTALREISEMLISSHRLADVLDVIELELPRLGVQSCYLALFDDVKHPLEQARLFLAYDTNGRVSREREGVCFSSRQLLPEGMSITDRSFGLVMEALYSKDERLGFMLLEVAAADASVCGALRGLLSSALQGVILWEQREEAEEQLRQYQRNLEQLVSDRTSELSQTNQKFERVIQELETKNAELERFAYTVSHDLKAPLVTIKGFLGYLREDTLSGNVIRLDADIRRISEAADKMHRLLSDLLELSRIGRMMNEPANIVFTDLIRDAIELTQGRLDEQNIKVDVVTELPVVFGDRQRLLEVMQNLLDNAAKFMGEQLEPRIEIGMRGAEQNKPVIYVRDNGIGIEPQFHERIFGLFNRLDPAVEGTGVGLTLVRRIIEFHGGRIWVESEEGKGATFLFTLPVRESGETQL